MPSQNLERQIEELEAVGTKVGPPFPSYSSRHVIIGQRLVIHPLLVSDINYDTDSIIDSIIILS